MFSLKAVKVPTTEKAKEAIPHPSGSGDKIKFPQLDTGMPRSHYVLYLDEITVQNTGQGVNWKLFLVLIKALTSNRTKCQA